MLKRFDIPYILKLLTNPSKITYFLIIDLERTFTVCQSTKDISNRGVNTQNDILRVVYLFKNITINSTIYNFNTKNIYV